MDPYTPSSRRPHLVRLMLLALSVSAVLAFVVTMERVPTPWYDTQLYASIARSVQLFGDGVPSALRDRPGMVDHTLFYGPVFFTAVAQAYDLIGVSQHALRGVSLAGALMLVAAAAALTWQLTRDRDRVLWTVALVLLTPEIGVSATKGSPSTVAVSLAMLAASAFVSGLSASRAWRVGPALAGLLLLLSIFTTPRAHPYAAAVFAAAAFVSLGGGATARRARVCLAILAGSFLACLALWGLWSAGTAAETLSAWWGAFTQEDRDVAVLTASPRDWAFRWQSALTPAVSVVAALAAAWRLSHARAEVSESESRAFSFLVAAGWLAFVASACLMDLTFTWGTYIVIPLFVAVLATPWPAAPFRGRGLAWAVTLVLVAFVAVRAGKYARVAATCESRDPAPVQQFVRRHVPEGSTVLGPRMPYFFVIEGAGSIYRFAIGESWADWTRWVPDDSSSAARPPLPVRDGGARFLMWPADEPLPQGFACAQRGRIDMFVPAPDHLDRLGPLGHTVDHGFPPTVLYRLSNDCPRPPTAPARAN